jgi:hypothetical protein
MVYDHFQKKKKKKKNPIMMHYRFQKISQCPIDISSIYMIVSFLCALKLYNLQLTHKHKSKSRRLSVNIDKIMS